METLENRTFDEIATGDTATLTRRLEARDIALFAAASGDVNPAHLDEDFAREGRFHEIVGHGMWTGALISTVLGTLLPGPGTIYLSQTLAFRRAVRVGDTLDVCVRATAKTPPDRVTFACEARNQRNEIVASGEAVVIAPTVKVRRAVADRPQAVLYERGDRIKALIARAAAGPPLRTAVAHPVNATTLEGVAGAVAANLITPILVGPRQKIEAAAREASFDLGRVELVDAPHSHAAAAAAVALAREGRADALMKGALHTDELMAAVVAVAGGLRTGRRISHVYVMDTPAYHKLLFITDAAINIAPDLEAKRDIAQNAIDLARALGVETPRLAVLSSVETVTAKLASTLDAAALCKMAERGQIVGGVVDGPLAFDNAISKEAAAAKGLSSDVAGEADILLTPDLEAGNMLAKQLDYLAGAVAAGVVLGARAPIILTSRSEGTLARVAASAVAKLYAMSEARVA